MKRGRIEHAEHRNCKSCKPCRPCRPCNDAWRTLCTSAALLLGLVSSLPAFTARAQALALPPQQPAQYLQRLDAQLPLSATFTDDNGTATRLGAFFGKRPVVMVLGYYHCPNLCSTLMDGVLESLAGVHLPPQAYRVVGVSIDPSETAEVAARKKLTYAPLVARAGGELHLLTAAQPQIKALAHSAGLQYSYDAATQQYAHPAGFLVATPEGRISHYFMGVRFDPRDVRLALVDASAGRIGSPVDRLVLLCSHYDPATGRYSTAVMSLVRAVCIAVLAVLCIGIWRARRSRA
jgi:protein SCO1/2